MTLFCLIIFLANFSVQTLALFSKYNDSDMPLVVPPPGLHLACLVVIEGPLAAYERDFAKIENLARNVVFRANHLWKDWNVFLYVAHIIFERRYSYFRAKSVSEVLQVFRRVHTRYLPDNLNYIPILLTVSRDYWDSEQIGDICSNDFAIVVPYYISEVSTVLRSGLMLARSIAIAMGLNYDNCCEYYGWCIMQQKYIHSGANLWSKCSKTALRDIIKANRQPLSCLRQKYNFFSGINKAVCGDGLVETSEDCDCDSAKKDCSMVCDSMKCKFLSNSTSYPESSTETHEDSTQSIACPNYNCPACSKDQALYLILGILAGLTGLGTLLAGFFINIQRTNSNQSLSGSLTASQSGKLVPKR